MYFYMYLYWFIHFFTSLTLLINLPKLHIIFESLTHFLFKIFAVNNVKLQCWWEKTQPAPVFPLIGMGLSWRLFFTWHGGYMHNVHKHTQYLLQLIGTCLPYRCSICLYCIHYLMFSMQIPIQSRDFKMVQIGFFHLGKTTNIEDVFWRHQETYKWFLYHFIWNALFILSALLNWGTAPDYKWLFHFEDYFSVSDASLLFTRVFDIWSFNPFWSDSILKSHHRGPILSMAKPKIKIKGDWAFGIWAHGLWCCVKEI